jgi:hypothetical protein
MLYEGKDAANEGRVGQEVLLSTFLKIPVVSPKVRLLTKFQGAFDEPTTTSNISP